MWKFTLLTVLALLAILVMAVGSLLGAVSILGDPAAGIVLAVSLVTMAVVVAGGEIRADRTSTPYW